MSPLSQLGWTPSAQERFERSESEGHEPARVVEERRGSYLVHAAGGEFSAELTGRMRHETASREDLPAVGDWVAIAARPQEMRATIHSVLPRKSALVRKSPERRTDAQVLAANLDTVFLVTSLNRDFNVRRIERTLALVWESGAQPVLLLSKSDLAEDADGCRAQAEAVAVAVPVLTLSAVTGAGLAELAPYLAEGRTAALIGSSGVGKSTLVNALAGEELVATGAIREDDDRGRHTTTRRQLLLLPGGGMLIDTPGMRGIGLWDGEEALSELFEDVESIEGQCRFGDCRHQGEPGCAVEAAIASGALDPGRLESHHKLEKELAFMARRQDQRLANDAKRLWKQRAKLNRARPRKGE